jgi:DNA-binding CsgD family transcriptional regulator
MAAPPLKVRKGSPPERGEFTAEELIRLLVSQVSTSGPAHSNVPWGTDSSYSEEILIDLDLDGVRYLLVRLPKADRARVRLSPREKEIVRMVAQGHPNKVIADVLNISISTVCTHVRRIFAKLGVGSRAAMAARHLELGRAGLRPGCPQPGSALTPASTTGPAQPPGDSRRQPARPSLTIPGKNYAGKGIASWP